MCSFALGMAGQVTYHLLAEAPMTRVPWAITTIVSCLPVLVLAPGQHDGEVVRKTIEAAPTQHMTKVRRRTNQRPWAGRFARVRVVAGTATVRTPNRRARHVGQPLAHPGSDSQVCHW